MASGSSSSSFDNHNPNDLSLVLTTNAPTDPTPTRQAWILAESIRRCFLMAEYMQSGYLTLKRGCSVCSGGVAFTPKAGLWDAGSAWEWIEKASYEIGGREMPVGVSHREGTGRFPRLLRVMEDWLVLKRECKEEEVDEFTRVVMGFAILGRVGGWGDSVCAVGGLRRVWGVFGPRWRVKVEFRHG